MDEEKCKKRLINGQVGHLIQRKKMGRTEKKDKEKKGDVDPETKKIIKKSLKKNKKLMEELAKY